MSIDKPYLFRRTEVFEQGFFAVFSSRNREEKTRDAAIATDTHPIKLLRDSQI